MMKAKAHGVIGRGVKECYVNDENILIFVMSDGKEIPIGFTGELKGIVPIDLGGTNAKNPADARKNLEITPGNIGAATSAEVDVERKRINNLASLKNGSTTGDAELTDIRVGYDGNVYPNAGAAVRGQVGELKNDLTNIEKLVYDEETFNLSWELGSFGANGEKADSLYRARVGDFYNVSNSCEYIIPASSEYGFAIQQYGDNNTFISAIGWLPENTIYSYIPDENVKNIRLNAKRLSGNADITDTDISALNSIDFVKKSKNVISELQENQEILKKEISEMNNKIINKKPHVMREWDCIVGQDGTIVKDKLWIFFDSSITPTIYIQDIVTDQATDDKTHGLGHCNSVDYNEHNDSLLVYKTNTNNEVGAIIYKNPSESDSLQLTDSNCTVVNMYNENSYLNPTGSICWGEDDKTIYMIDGCYSNLSNNTPTSEITISKIRLGMGDNDLSINGGYGTFVSGKENAEYNGTCKVVKVYHGSITEGIDVEFGSNKIGTAQGMEFDGYIYIAWGFSGHNFLAIELNDNDNTYRVVKNYMHKETDYTGENIVYLEPELLALNGNKIICGSSNGAQRSLYSFER